MDYEVNNSEKSWPWWRVAMTVLMIIVLGLSLYLTWHSLVGGAMVGCDVGSPCDQVISSRWSTIGGFIPVSALAAGVYMALLSASFFIGPSVEFSLRRLAWFAMLVLVGSVAGSAVWFIVLQKWAIGAFCPYCMTAHVLGLILAALVIWQSFGKYGDRSTDEVTADDMPGQASPSRPLDRIISPLFSLGLPLVGLGMAGFLAIVQVLITPPAVYREGQSQGVAPVAEIIHAGPIVGSPDAPYIVTMLFDYKCSHCQKMHFMLDETVRRCQGKLAIVLRPTPLNTQCNPHIPRDVEEFKDSCQLARIGLAVWYAKPEVFAAFELWMFTMESGDYWKPRGLEAVRAKAIELLGQDKFDAALADPWIDQYMQESISIFGRTGDTAIPKLIFGTRWVIPEPYDIDDLISILRESLDVPLDI